MQDQIATKASRHASHTRPARSRGHYPSSPEHMVPLAPHLAAQDASGITGKMFDVMEWNIEHGLGGHERWADTSFSYEALMPR